MSDLISREALIQELQSAKYLCYDNNSISRIQNCEIDRCISFVEDAPTVEERPTGEWIYTDIEDKRKGYGGYCSICKCDMPIFMEDWKHKYCETSYCPNCGAKMKGEEE